MESTHKDYIYRLGIQAHPTLTSSPVSFSSSSEANFPIVTLAIIGIICTSLLLLSYHLFVTKCCLNWQQFSILRQFSTRQDRGEEGQFMAYSSEIRNQGLRESVIHSIPIFQFQRALVGGGYDDEENTHECAVCLNEFQQDERLRLLTNCSHAFHIDCIDTWLQNNVNCPLCRSSISQTTPFLPPQPMVQNPYQDYQQTTHHLADGDANVVIEVDSDGTDETATSQYMRTSAETSSQSVSCHKNPCLRNMEQRNLSRRKRRFSHVSSMGDECIDVRDKDDLFSVSPIRRSFSLDFSTDMQLYLSVRGILQQNPHIHEDSSSNGGASCKIRMSLFSLGCGCGCRNSVIPIPFDP